MSLVLAILGSLCLGPIGGLAAILVGTVALWDIRSSQGKKSGGVIAWIGVIIGGVTTFSYAAVILLVVYSGSTAASAPSSPALTPPRYTPHPTAPSPTLPSPQDGITMSREMNTTVARIGKIVVVDIGLSELSLDAAVRKQRTAAHRDGEKLVLHTTSTLCRPCQAVAAALTDPKMQQALSGVRLVRVDINDFQEELADLGFPYELIPGFFLLRADLTPSDGVHGGEWDDDTSANIAPVLHSFVRGTYTKRRHPFKGGETPKPHGTIL